MIDKSRPTDRHCSECGKPSHLRLVIPSNDKPTYDECFFECQSCGYSETLYVSKRVTSLVRPLVFAIADEAGLSAPICYRHFD